MTSELFDVSVVTSRETVINVRWKFFIASCVCVCEVLSSVIYIVFFLAVNWLKSLVSTLDVLDRQYHRWMCDSISLIIYHDNNSEDS